MKVSVTKGSRYFEEDDSPGFKGQPPNARARIDSFAVATEEETAAGAL
jgi:hypothetical protein